MYPVGKTTFQALVWAASLPLCAHMRAMSGRSPPHVRLSPTPPFLLPPVGIFSVIQVVSDFYFLVPFLRRVLSPLSEAERKPLVRPPPPDCGVVVVGMDGMDGMDGMEGSAAATLGLLLTVT